MASPEATAQQLTELAGRPSLQFRSSQLLRLAACVAGSTDEDWAELDLQHEFAVSEPLDLLAGSPEAAVVKKLDSARTVLIFAPIAVTWLGIALAARAYGAAIQSNPNLSSEPFIALWERGFDGYGGFSLRLSMLGVIDFLLILALIVLSFVVASKRSAIEDATMSAFEQDKLALVVALTDAHLCLAGRKLSSPVRFQEELTRTATGLRELFTTIDDLGRVNRASSDAARDLTEAVQGSAQEVRAMLVSLEQSTTDVNKAVVSLSVTTDRVSDRLAETANASVSVAQQQHGATVGMQRAVDALEATANELSNSSTGLADASGAAAEDRVRFVEQLKTERALHQKLATTLNKALAGLDAMTLGVGGLTGELVVTADRVEKASAQFSAVSGSIEAATVSMPQQIAATTAGLDEVLRTHTDLAKLLRQTAATLAVTVDQVREDMERLDDLLQTVVERSSEALAAGVGTDRVASTSGDPDSTRSAPALFARGPVDGEPY